MIFNLIVSTYRHRELDAQNELHFILKMFGDHHPTSQVTNVSGLLTARTTLDPFQVIERVKGLIHEEPWNIRFILRMIPIEISFFINGIHPIREAATKLSSKMHASDTFRITVERRATAMTSSELISNLGSTFNNIVDLENPHWIVLVEIIGKIGGVSIVRPYDIFSAIRESRIEV